MVRDPYAWRDIDQEHDALRQRYEWACEDRDTDLRDLRQRHELETASLRRLLDYTLEHAATLTHLAFNPPVMIVQAAELPNWPSHLPLVLPIRGAYS